MKKNTGFSKEVFLRRITGLSDLWGGVGVKATSKGNIKGFVVLAYETGGSLLTGYSLSMSEKLMAT